MNQNVALRTPICKLSLSVKCGPQTSSISFTSGLVRNADSLPPRSTTSYLLNQIPWVGLYQLLQETQMPAPGSLLDVNPKVLSNTSSLWFTALCIHTLGAALSGQDSE